jgi:hypothetical protein
MALLLPWLPSCYSVFQRRSTIIVDAEGVSECVLVESWHEQGWGFFDYPVLATPVVLLMYPFDVVASTLASLHCAWSDDYRLRWGPLGALAAIALPGVTASPGMIGPSFDCRQRISPARMKELLEEVRADRGEAAIRGLDPTWTDEIATVRILRTERRDPP